MSEPSREHVRPDPTHVEALAINFVWHNLMSAGEATRAAETILTSSDPAVLDAMQDALVRAGRLTEVRDFGWRIAGVGDRWNCAEAHVDSVVKAERSHPTAPIHVVKLTRRRFITEWQQVQP